MTKEKNCADGFSWHNPAPSRDLNDKEISEDVLPKNELKWSDCVSLPKKQGVRDAD